MPSEPNTPQQEDPFVVEAEFTPEEFDVLRELSKQLELTGVQVLRQALRCYQLIATGHSKLVEANPIPKMQPQPPQSAARVDIDALEKLLPTYNCDDEIRIQYGDLSDLLAEVRDLRETLGEIPEALREEARVRAILKSVAKTVAPLAAKELAGEHIPPGLMEMRLD